MKRIFWKFLIGISGLGVIIGICLMLSLISPFTDFFSWITASEGYDNGPTEEILPYITKVRTESEYSKLIIGDSVCHQIFNPLQEYNEIYATVGSNQAVSIVGQYLLAEEFVKNHENVTDIYLITTRLTGTGFGFRGIAYQYFVIPFTQGNVLQNADAETKDIVTARFGKFWTEPIVVKAIDRSPMIKRLFLNLVWDGDYEDRELSIYYLERFLTLCDENKIRFHLIYAPVAESTKESVEREHNIISGFCKNERMQKLIDSYYESVIYYQDEAFCDGSHFTEEYETPEGLSDIVRQMADKNDLLSDFVLPE